MKCNECDHDCKTKFCGACGAEMPVPELEEIRRWLQKNADRNNACAVEIGSNITDEQDAEPLDPKRVAQQEGFIELRDKWQRLADAQAQAIEDLKPTMPETKRELTREELAAESKA